ncbi:hypothetical protein D3C78_1419740 [compost metagenome]
MMGRPYVVSGNVIALEAAGMLGGNYLITSSRHSFSRSGGYSAEQQVCRVSSAVIGLTLDYLKPDQLLNSYGIPGDGEATA